MPGPERSSPLLGVPSYRFAVGKGRPATGGADETLWRLNLPEGARFRMTCVGTLHRVRPSGGRTEAVGGETNRGWWLVLRIRVSKAVCSSEPSTTHS